MKAIQLRRMKAFNPLDSKLYEGWLKSKSGIDYAEWLIVQKNPLMISHVRSTLPFGDRWIGWATKLEGIDYGIFTEPTAGGNV